MSGKQMEAVSSTLMDSSFERQSHERFMRELQDIFNEPLKRLDAITEQEWDDAE